MWNIQASPAKQQTAPWRLVGGFFWITWMTDRDSVSVLGNRGSGQFNLKEGASGLFLQTCMRSSNCVRLAHQGVCPIWGVLTNFFRPSLPGKRSEASETVRDTSHSLFCTLAKKQQHWSLRSWNEALEGRYGYKNTICQVYHTNNSCSTFLH